ncbi:DMT family transporter [Rhodoferax sp.]|uniref:DMT family transporter n=1 Tax=Rhodoferax sp. TaxID=50421 RepID=UPI00374DBC88
MDAPKPLDTQASATMLVLCMVWGLQQVAIKAAAPDIAPILQISLRSGLAALLVGLLMAWRKQRVEFAHGAWRPGLAVGCLFALEYLLVGEGLRFTSASHMVVFLYTAPIFVALGLHWKLPAERLSPLKWLGIALAFAGILLTFVGRSAPAGADQPTHVLWGDALGLLAGMCWGATTVVLRCSSLAKASAAQTLLYQLVAAFVLLLLAAFVLGQTTVHLTPMLWSSLLFQAVIVSFISFLVWFGLLRRYLASQLSVFTFLTPLFGMAFGVWLLDEPLEIGFVLGAVCVLAGVVLVSSEAWLKQNFQRVKKQLSAA